MRRIKSKQKPKDSVQALSRLLGSPLRFPFAIHDRNHSCCYRNDYENNKEHHRESRHPECHLSCPGDDLYKLSALKVDKVSASVVVPSAVVGASQM